MPPGGGSFGLPVLTVCLYGANTRYRSSSACNVSIIDEIDYDRIFDFVSFQHLLRRRRTLDLRADYAHCRANDEIHDGEEGCYFEEYTHLFLDGLGQIFSKCTHYFSFLELLIAPTSAASARRFSGLRLVLSDFG